jgi:GAF domain-containing protein
MSEKLAFGPNSSPDKQMSQTYASLHLACAARGTLLFTVTVQDLSQDVTRRAYSSHPIEYPVTGTKPLTRDDWYDHCITRQQTFVANTTPEFARYFFDHALITSLGLGSCINIPVVQDGEVLGTVNLLAEEQHFTPERLASYHALTQDRHAALVTAMLAR